MLPVTHPFPRLTSLRFKKEVFEGMFFDVSLNTLLTTFKFPILSIISEWKKLLDWIEVTGPFSDGEEKLWKITSLFNKVIQVW